MINIINALDRKKFIPQVLLLKDSAVSTVLKKNNIDFNIASSKFYSKYYQYYAHIEAGYIKWYSLYKLCKHTILWILSRYFFSTKELQRFDCDIIHLNSSVLTDWLAPSKKKAKVIYHIQEPITCGALGVRYSFFRYLVKKYANRIIAISKDNAERINIPEKTEVIYNYAEELKGSPSIDSYYSKKVLYLGGASEIKGFFTLVDSLDYLNEGVEIYFCGNYENTKSNKTGLKRVAKNFLFRNIKKRKAIDIINRHKCAKKIGMIENANLLLNDVCCLVSPFTVSHFSRPVIEAHLFKKPVVVTDIEGIDEIVKNGENGIIVPKKDPRSLAEAINEITSKPKMAMAMGNSGYLVAIEKFTKKNIQSFNKLYSELVHEM